MAPKHEHRSQYIALAAAIVIYAVTAWHSTGYHGADEHHQIIAFAQHRMGELPSSHVAWEYGRSMRASALPWIAMGVMNSARSAGIADPLALAFLLRTMTALFALLVLRRSLSVLLPGTSPSLRTPFIILTWSLWFLPFQLVRFSGETWSGLFLFLGILVALDDGRNARWPLLTGTCLMMSIWLRPPMAIAAFGLLAWLVVVRHEAWRAMVRMAMGFAIMATIAFALDSLFYGHATFSPWHYLRTGVDGPPAHKHFPAMPWWYYPPWIVKYALPPIGMALLASLATLLWRDRRNVLLWCMLPFLVAHSLLPHKELRFLYPLAAMMPWLIMAAWDLLRVEPSMKFVPRWVLHAAIAVLLPCNMAGLAVVSTQPAGTGNTAFVKALRADNDAPVTYAIGASDAWRLALPPFHRTPLPGDTAVPTKALTTPLPTPYLIASAAEIGMVQARTGQHCTLVIGSHAPWAQRLLHHYHWGERVVDWTLYRVEASSSR